MQIAFFGLGHMGAPMATHLIDPAHTVWVYDLDAEKVESLIGQGARRLDLDDQAWRSAAVVISMLPHGAAVEQLYWGSMHVLDGLAPGTLILDCSTVAPSTSRMLHAQVQERDMICLDAPVSGGVGGAQAATLSFLCGGSVEAVQAARPVLERMGQHVLHAGPAGAGSVAKICNNMLLAIQMIGTAEALALGVAQGLDPAVLSELMRNSSGNNWVLDRYNPWPGIMSSAPASRDYQGGFSVQLMHKDLGLAQNAAAQVQQGVPLGALALQLYALHQSCGYSQEDFSSIIKLLKARNLS